MRSGCDVNMGRSPGTARSSGRSGCKGESSFSGVHRVVRKALHYPRRDQGDGMSVDTYELHT